MLLNLSANILQTFIELSAFILSFLGISVPYFLSYYAGKYKKARNLCGVGFLSFFRELQDLQEVYALDAILNGNVIL